MAPAHAPPSGRRRVGDGFEGQVRDALVHVHDLPYLQKHALVVVTRPAPSPRGAVAFEAGAALQRALFAAIDALRPTTAADTAGARRHRLLVLRYVEALPAAATQARLAVSRAEYFREHRAALATLADLLREQGNVRGPAPQRASAASLAPAGPSAAAGAPPAPAGNLPAALSSFVGREAELDVLRAHLRESGVRLTTLTGPGGVGKTRLALAVAAATAAGFPDGAWFVALGPLTDPERVAAAVAQGLGVRERAGEPLVETLKDALRAKRVLLVLDNLEHLLAAAPLVPELLAACPELRVLATSRAPLRVSGEHEYPVPALRVPDPVATGTLTAAGAVRELAGMESVRLFVERARAVQPGFAVTAANAAPVAAICRLLDGLPLSLELAAARVKVLPPEALLHRLTHRLSLLTGGSRDAPPRQQTLRATLDWSYQLLVAGEPGLFSRLAVFAGGCTLEAAEAVCGAGGESAGSGDDLLEGLASLVAKSLLRQERAAGEPRFVMLETIREYALERLAETDATAAFRARHAGYYLALAEAAAPERHGPVQGRWLTRLATEHENLRAALHWTITQGDAPRAARLGGALCWFWEGHGHAGEGRAWLARVLALPGLAAHPRLRAQALAAAGRLARIQKEFGEARRLLEASTGLFREQGDRYGEGTALRDLGLALHRGGDDAGRDALEASLVVFRTLEARPELAETLTMLATVLRDTDAGAALPLFEEGLVRYREGGDRRGEASVLQALGNLALGQGDYDRARARSARALALLRELGDVGVWVPLANLAQVALFKDERDTARALGEDLLALGRERRFPVATVCGFETLGFLALASGDATAARRYFGEGLAATGPTPAQVGRVLDGFTALAAARGQAVRAWRLTGAAAPREDGWRRHAFEQRFRRARLEPWLALARAGLSEASRAAAEAEGRAMTAAQAKAYALEDADDDV